MSRSLDRLYEMLPAVHRLRDAEHDYPLRALLRVINEQVNVVEDDIAQLYENWFIETCDDWVVPYIGDVIGYRPMHQAQDVGPGARTRVPAARREVANTLARRRRKGSLALLELLAADVANWPARAVEFYALLAWQQHLNHLRPNRARTIELRRGQALDLIGGPFDTSARTADLRRINSAHRAGRYNLTSIGVFVWRLKVYSVTHAPACRLENAGAECFTFNVLGHDTPLYCLARPEAEPTAIAEELNLPVPIRRRALEQRISHHPPKTRVDERLYGEGNSLALYAPGWPSRHAVQPVPREHVVVADLSNWTYRAPRGVVAVDPVLGRIAFPVGQVPKRGVWVNYHAAFSADMGAGEYPRTLSQPLAFALYAVSQQQPGATVFETIEAALLAWRAEQHALGAPPPEGDPGLPNWTAAWKRLRAAVIEIGDSGTYTERIVIELGAGESVQIRAGNRHRPVIYLAERGDGFSVSGQRASRFTLDGVIVAGRGIRVVGPDRAECERQGQGSQAGDLCDITLRHVTLVPGWALGCDCDPRRPNEASLELLYTTARVRIEHSILGAIEVAADEVQSDPLEISISDSIVDGRGALRGASGMLAFARLYIARSTVLGDVGVHAIGLAENSIFSGVVTAGRRQHGCVRYCYLAPGSRTPSRYRCQGAADSPVEPRFTSIHYGNPAYCQLACDCPAEIARGADDESEMGAFHDLYQPQRETNLRARLDEYTPAGMDVGILFAN